MSKLILTGVDGNLGQEAAKVLMSLEDKDNLVFCGYSEKALKPYQDMGITTHVTDFNYKDGLVEAFKGADALALISMPFVGVKRQAAHRNCIDAAKEAGLAYIFMRNSQYAEAMITNYFTYVHLNAPLTNNQGDGLMAYISRKDCAKAVAYGLHRAFEYGNVALNINGAELMTISQFIEYGNKATGNHVTYKFITDEENYAVFDAMGVPRTTDGKFKDGSEAPFSSEGMVTFGQSIRVGKMAKFTDDFKKLTGDDPITVSYMFEHSDDFQIGDRHSKDKK